MKIANVSGSKNVSSDLLDLKNCDPSTSKPKQDECACASKFKPDLTPKKRSPAHHALGLGVSLSSPNLLNSAVSCLMLSGSSSDTDLSEPENLPEETNLICELSNDENDVDVETMSGENDVEYAEFSMAQRMIAKEPGSAALSPTNLMDCFEEKLKLLQFFGKTPQYSTGSSSPSTSVTALMDMTNTNLDLALLGSPLDTARLDNRKKLKHRFKMPETATSPSTSSHSGVWTETVPLTHNTKESVMGPLESFLRSINCYPEHDQNRRKESPTKDKRRVPLMQAKLTLPSSPPPMSDTADSCPQPSTSSGFSWTPALLNQRKISKSSRIPQAEFALPEKEVKKADDSPHST